MKEPTTTDEKELWAILDAMVLQWIYSTISTDLLHTIIEPDAAAMATWNRLQDIFQDNKNSRIVAVEQEFSHSSMEDFPHASAYYQRLKELSNQLKNVGSPVSNDRLVLQLVSGFTSSYSIIGMWIRQTNPLPPFYQARSMLTLEEAGYANQTAIGTTSTMVAASPDSDESLSESSFHSYYSGGKKALTSPPQNTRKSGGKGGSGGLHGVGGGSGGRW